MPWDSAATNAMISGFQQSAFQNLAFSQQLSLGGMSGNPGVFADQAMGMGMNRLQGWGGPLLQAGMGVAGLDPLSLGMRAGGAAFRGGGGLLGGGLAGMGAFGAASAGMALGGYAANQMFIGAQQQQGVNAALRSSFGFFNPATGGQGFSLNQSGQIGGMLRQMTHQPGPMGEVAGMGELTQLAANMGRMGLANNVRDVQEFSRKFREMVGNLKTIAHEMGTSLREAQEFTMSMRNSGIFRASDQAKFAIAAKQTAFGGGMALSEVTGMANIGAQISRSIGGMGRAGAFAGMRTIGQIGTAQQMGILSDEDIYNATGLSGAEGRQAFATSSMQHAARFLMSGRGRRTLASLAGENGSLDEGAVAQLMSGDMGIAETMRNSGRNLSRVGRANFIRNEGRLRGAALERLGGFLPAIQLSQWASSKGIDINEMDDRSMLFAQRQLGMGRDEMDATIRIAQRLPEIMREQKSSASEQRFMDRMGEYRKGTGIEGIKNRMNQARERVNSSLQRVGQAFFQEGSEMIERWVNDMSGAYEMRYSKELETALRSGSSQSAQAKIDSLMRGARGGGGASTSNFFRGSTGTGIGLTYLTQGQSMAGRYQDAGYRLSASVISDEDRRGRVLRQELREISDIQRAAAQGPDQKFLAMTQRNASWIADAYGFGAIKGGGWDRMKAFETILMQKGTNEMRHAWEGASQADRARMMVTAAGVVGGGSAREQMEAARQEAGMFSSPDALGMFGSGANPADARNALMERLGYRGPTSILAGMGQGFLSGGRRGVMTGAGLGLYGGGLGAFFGSGIGGGIGAAWGALTGGIRAARSVDDRSAYAGAAEYLQGDDAAKMIGALQSSDTEVRSQAKQRMVRELKGLRDSSRTGDYDPTTRGGIIGRSTVLMGTETLRLKQMLAAGQISKEQFGQGLMSIGQLSAAGESGFVAQAHAMATGALTAMDAADLVESQSARANSERIQTLVKKVSGEASDSFASFQLAGLGSSSEGRFKLGADAEKRFGKQGAAYLAMRGSGLGLLAGAQSGYDVTTGMGQLQAGRNMLLGMSVAQRRKLAAAAAEAGDIETSEEIGSQVATEERVRKGMGRGTARAIGAGLGGISLSKEQESAVNGAIRGGDKAKAAQLLAQFTAGGDATARKDFETAIGQLGKGQVGAASMTLQSLAANNSKFREAQEERQKKEQQAQMSPGDKAIVEAIKGMSDRLAGAIGNIKDGAGDPAGGGGGKNVPTGKGG